MIKTIWKNKKWGLIILVCLWFLYLFSDRNAFQTSENLLFTAKMKPGETSIENMVETVGTFTASQNYISGLEVKLNKKIRSEQVTVSVKNEKGKELKSISVPSEEKTKSIQIDFQDELYVGKGKTFTVSALVWNANEISAKRCTVQYYPFLKLECIVTLLFAMASIGILFLDAVRKKRYFDKTKKVSVLHLVSLLGHSGIVFWLMEFVFQNQNLVNMQTKLIVLNILCIFAVFLVLLFLFNSMKAAVVCGSVFFLIWGIANQFVFIFKGQAIQPIDLKSIRTAATVAAEYDYTLTWEMRLGISVCMLILLLWIRMSDQKVSVQRSMKKQVITRVPGVILAGLMGVILFGTSFIPDMELITNMWRSRNCFHEQGTVIAFCNYWHNMQIEKPEGYSRDQVSAFAGKYLSDISSGKDAAEDVKPNIIVIMNEAFVDLSYYGEFETDIPYMENYHAISENAIKGYALANIYGAGTANSEYEFLTGHTLTFMPTSIPYAEHIQEPHYSMATTLVAQGYEATAIHPMQARNWRRSVVYPNFGFESFYSTDNMDFSDVDYERNYISDAHTYKMVMEQLKVENGKPDFILDITVQNHGGYVYAEDDFTHDVHILDYHSSKIDQYLSLIRKSDIALGEFIKELETFEEPTVVAFFGDHYPKLPDEFYAWLNPEHENPSQETLQKLYSVPFFIWANYDIEEEKDVLTSLNYLGAKTLETAGVEMSPYDVFRLELSKEIPALNQFGYVDASGQHHTYEEEGSEQERLKEYWMMQYNEMFDQKGKVAELFER